MRVEGVRKAGDREEGVGSERKGKGIRGEGKGEWGVGKGVRETGGGWWGVEIPEEREIKIE